MATVRGGYRMIAHAQAWADAVEAEVGADNHGTYAGHSPTPDRAIDTFSPVPSDRRRPGTPGVGRVLGDDVADFTLAHWDEFGVRYQIWRQCINWNDGLGWKLMENRGSITQNHFDHDHTSFETSASGRPQPPKESRYMPGTTTFVSLGRDEGLVMDVDVATALVEGRPARGGRVIVWPDRGGANQAWTFEIVDDRFFRMRSTWNQSFVLDNDPASEIIHLYDPIDGAQQQHWYYVDMGVNIVKIKNRLTGRVLDVSGNGPRGSRVIGWDDLGVHANQLWVRKTH